MSLPAGLLASVMGGQPLTSMLSIPCGICTASGTEAPDQAVTLVAGTLVCGAYHASVALQITGHPPLSASELQRLHDAASGAR